jgi:energy-coupling factor transporter transmembrane protein EcfT
MGICARIPIICVYYLRMLFFCKSTVCALRMFLFFLTLLLVSQLLFKVSRRSVWLILKLFVIGFLCVFRVHFISPWYNPQKWIVKSDTRNSEIWSQQQSFPIISRIQSIDRKHSSQTEKGLGCQPQLPRPHLPAGSLCTWVRTIVRYLSEIHMVTHTTTFKL